MSRWCLVPHGCASPTPCTQHAHISTSERDDLLRHHAVEWLQTPDKKARQRGILRFLGAFSVRGFSARYGEALAMQRNGWLCRLMLSEMRHCRMEES